MKLMSIKWIILLEIPKSYAIHTTLTGSKHYVQREHILNINKFNRQYMNSVRVIIADDGFSHICCREDVSKLTFVFTNQL